MRVDRWGAAVPAGEPGAGGTIRVLVVDGDAEVRRLISRTLDAVQCDVTAVATGAEARRQLALRPPPEVVLLDVAVSDTDGYALLHDVVSVSQVPTVVVSARRAEADRVRALEMGAADYVLKPFFPRELALRVRRAALDGGRGTAELPRVLEFGELTIDLASHDVLLRGERVPLAAREFALLAHLARAPRQAFSREALLAAVWRSRPEWQSAKTVTEHVRRLRTKLEDDPHHPRWVVTSGSGGYRFEP